MFVKKIILILSRSILVILLLLNFFLISAHSSGAITIGTLLIIIMLWFLGSVPLSFVGAFAALKRQPLKDPVKTNQIPRQIPKQEIIQRGIPNILISGILPFGAIFIEFYFIMGSIWADKVLDFLIYTLTLRFIMLLDFYFAYILF